MQLSLSAEDRALRDELREFFTSEVPQEIREWVLAGGTPRPDHVVTSQRILNAAGLAVPAWPVEWGGKSWNQWQRAIWLAELHRAGVPDPLGFNATMVGPVIATFGNEDQKQRFLPATANIDIWWAQGFSEPGAGSDLASLRTRAHRDGDHFVVNGQKTWTTLAQHADWIFCLVRTDPDAPKPQRGISFLLIDLRSPGVTVRPIELIDNTHEVNDIFFDEVRVPVENLVGVENEGWSYAKFLLGNERTGTAQLGRSKARLARAKRLAVEPGPDGAVLLDDPGFAARLAEIENELLALELTMLRVATTSANGKPNPASSVLKLRGSELIQATTELVLEVAGTRAAGAPAGAEGDPSDWAGQAFSTYQNMRKVTIFGGSSEVQRSIISSSILGL